MQCISRLFHTNLRVSVIQSVNSLRTEIIINAKYGFIEQNFFWCINYHAVSNRFLKDQNKPDKMMIAYIVIDLHVGSVPVLIQ